MQLQHHPTVPEAESLDQHSDIEPAKSPQLTVMISPGRKATNQPKAIHLFPRTADFAPEMGEMK